VKKGPSEKKIKDLALTSRTRRTSDVGGGVEIPENKNQKKRYWSLGKWQKQETSPDNEQKS